jgi:toxin ParE1/3/4
MAHAIITPSAVRDLNEITDWLAEHDLGAALRFYDEVDRILRLLTSHPLLGELVEDLAPEMRRHSLWNYQLYYLPQDGKIELIRVLHGARDVSQQFNL